MLLSAVALLLLSSPKPAPLPDGEVSYVTPGAAVPAALDGLGKAANIHLFAPKAFESDILVLRLKDAPLSRVMNEIADRTAGDWVKKDDGYELVRSTEKVHADEKAELAFETDMYKRAITKQKATLAKLEPWNEATAKSIVQALVANQKAMGDDWDPEQWQKLAAIGQRAPGGRAMTRIIASLNPEDVAALPYDYRIVFSDRPNRLQRPLPAAISQALTACLEEQNLWSDVADRLYDDSSVSYYTSADLSMRKSFQNGRGKTLLAITKQRSSGVVYATVELMMTNAKGQVVLRGNQSLNPWESDFKMPEPAPNEEAIEPTPLAKAIGQRGSGDNNKPLPPDLAEKLLNPEKFEPISLSLGDTFVNMATKNNVNLVATLGDETFAYSTYSASQKVTPTMLFTLLKLVAMDVDQKDGWWTMSPKLRARSRAERMDRAVIGKYVRLVQKNGRVGIDDMAAYALGIPGEIYNSLGFQIGNLLLPVEESTYYDTDLLRFYGRLSPMERQSLLKGGGLAISRLNQGAAQELNKMIFGEAPNLQPTPPQDGSESEGYEDFYNGILREPTELFGNGFPPNSTLKLDDSSQQVAGMGPYEARPGVMYGGQSMGPEEIAQALYAKERPGLFPWVEEGPPIDGAKFRFGTQRNLQFNFEFGKLANMNKVLQENTFKGDAVPYEQLPADFRKQVEERLVEMRKNYKDVKPGDLGGRSRQTAPPP